MQGLWVPSGPSQKTPFVRDPLRRFSQEGSLRGPLRSSSVLLLPGDPLSPFSIPSVSHGVHLRTNTLMVERARNEGVSASPRATSECGASCLPQPQPCWCLLAPHYRTPTQGSSASRFTGPGQCRARLWSQEQSRDHQGLIGAGR